MKVAHILPPRVAPKVADDLGDQHLLLPALVPSETYRDFYGSRAGIDWMTLDNGVAEGKLTSFDHLLSMARLLGVQEVVLPDVMANMDRTLDALVVAFHQAFDYRNRFRFMFVVQGLTPAEMVHSAEQAMNMCPIIVGTFGIPRHILDVYTSARAEIAYALNERFPGKSIHLLGTHPSAVTELLDYADDFKSAGVRSVDTSLAWNAMLESVRLKEPKSLSYNLSIKRQPIEQFLKADFEVGFGEAQQKMLQENMGAINSWVK